LLNRTSGLAGLCLRLVGSSPLWATNDVSGAAPRPRRQGVPQVGQDDVAEDVGCGAASPFLALTGIEKGGPLSKRRAAPQTGDANAFIPRLQRPHTHQDPLMESPVWILQDDEDSTNSSPIPSAYVDAGPIEDDIDRVGTGAHSRSP
jgi:hypothetical protein